jgi:hypothetical protein
MSVISLLERRGEDMASWKLKLESREEGTLVMRDCLGILGKEKSFCDEDGSNDR